MLWEPPLHKNRGFAENLLWLARVQGQLGDLRLIVSGFHKGVDLISFNLAEMFVGHGQLRLAGQEALNAKHSQPPSPQLIKVALRT